MPHQIRRQRLVIQTEDASLLTVVVAGLSQLKSFTVGCSLSPTAALPRAPGFA